MRVCACGHGPTNCPTNHILTHPTAPPRPARQVTISSQSKVGKEGAKAAAAGGAELGAIAAQIEAKEWRWMELAEIAGDI